MKFEDAVEIILDLEGGEKYTNDPRDPGGETKWGISKRAHPKEDIKNLTKTRAVEIYRETYWNNLPAEKLPPVIRLAVFDAAVNQGPLIAIRILQMLVGAKMDGKLGPDTVSKVWAADPQKLLDAYLYARLKHYSNLGGWKTYGVGWAKRLLEIATKF